MAYPTKPSIQTSYTAVEQALGDGTLPGQELDNDLANLKTSLDALNDFVRGVTRSDGKLANQSVRRETLGPDILLGFGAPTTWTASRAYVPPQTVFFEDAFYICVIEHTSGADFATDLTANRWELLVDFGAVLDGALAAEDGAQAVLAEFRTRYIGAAASDPTVDPAGGALIDGALYWNNGARRLKAYDLATTAWYFVAPTAAEQTNINTVAGISADVTSVAGVAASVPTVAAIDTNVTTVAGIAPNVTTVAGIAPNVTTVAGVSADVTTVAGIAPNVTTVAGVAADVPTVAGISANVTTVAGIAPNVTTVAGVSADVTTVAGVSADVTSVAGVSANVTTVAGISAAVSTVAANVADVTNFADVYLGPAAANPTLRTDGTALQTGDLYFNTVADEMRVYDGTVWKAAGSAVNGTTRRQSFTATAGQTVFTVTGGYDAGFADVYLNGVKLVNGTDVTVTSGTEVVLTVGAADGDSVDVVAYGAFEVANTYTQAETDGFLAAKASLTGVETLTNKTLTSLNGGPLAGFRNAIINGNFDHWQRGTSLSAATGNRFLADRWRSGSDGTTIAPSRQAFAPGQTDVPNEPTYFHRNVVSSSAGAGNNAIFIQKIEGVRTLAGQTATLSFYAKADAAKNIVVEFVQNFGTGGSPSAEVNAIGVATLALTTTFQEFTVTAAIPSIAGKTIGTDGNDTLSVFVWFDAGSNFNARTNSLGQQSGTFDIAQVQLEAGSVATPFERRPVGVELALCQRYFQRYGNASFRTSAASGGLDMRLSHNYNTVMRATASVSLSSGSTVNATTVEALAGNPSQAVLRVISSAAGLSGFIDATLTADAEL